MSEAIDSIGSIGAVGAVDQGVGPIGPAVAPAPASPRAQAQAGSSARAPAPQPAPQQSSPSLQAAVQQINTHLSAYGRVMELRVDAASGVTVAQIVNSQTGAVLQQIPSSDVLRLADMLNGWAHGKDSALVDLMA